MAYVGEWQRLSEALTHVMEATGISKDEAQADICRAIADGVIRMRGELGRRRLTHTTSAGTVLTEEDFEIPTDLGPKDLDWEQSRPLKEWFVRRGRFHSPGYWSQKCTKLFRSDVNKVLCLARGSDKPTTGTPATSTSRAALEGEETPVGPKSAGRSRRPDAVGPARRRGPRPRKLDRTKDAMRDDVRQGRFTVEDLSSMVEEALAANYGVSRDTARKARNEVLSEFSVK